MTDHAELIARIENASAADQSDVIRAALRHALDQGWITVDAYKRAQLMCNAGAFVDAALTLIPEGHAWSVRWNRASDGELYGDARCWRFCHPRDDETPTHRALAATPALALSAAALRARSTP